MMSTKQPSLSITKNQSSSLYDSNNDNQSIHAMLCSLKNGMDRKFGLYSDVLKTVTASSKNVEKKLRDLRHSFKRKVTALTNNDQNYYDSYNFQHHHDKHNRARLNSHDNGNRNRGNHD